MPQKTPERIVLIENKMTVDFFNAEKNQWIFWGRNSRQEIYDLSAANASGKKHIVAQHSCFAESCWIWMFPKIGVFTPQIIHLFIGFWNHYFHHPILGGKFPTIFGLRPISRERERERVRVRLACQQLISSYAWML